MTDTTAPVYLTADEVAAELRTTVDWVRRACADKRLPAKKVGKSYRISRADLNAYMSP